MTSSQVRQNYKNKNIKYIYIIKYYSGLLRTLQERVKKKGPSKNKKHSL